MESYEDILYKDLLLGWIEWFEEELRDLKCGEYRTKARAYNRETLRGVDEDIDTNIFIIRTLEDVIEKYGWTSEAVEKSLEILRVKESRNEDEYNLSCEEDSLKRFQHILESQMMEIQEHITDIY